MFLFFEAFLLLRSQSPMDGTPDVATPDVRMLFVRSSCERQASFPSRWFEPIPNILSICNHRRWHIPCNLCASIRGFKSTQVVSGLHPFSTQIMRTHSSILVAHFPSLSAAAARARKLRKRSSSAQFSCCHDMAESATNQALLFSILSLFCHICSNIVDEALMLP